MLWFRSWLWLLLLNELLLKPIPFIEETWHAQKIIIERERDRITLGMIPYKHLAYSYPFTTALSISHKSHRLGSQHLWPTNGRPSYCMLLLKICEVTDWTRQLLSQVCNLLGQCACEHLWPKIGTIFRTLTVSLSSSFIYIKGCVWIL